MVVPVPSGACRDQKSGQHLELVEIPGLGTVVLFRQYNYTSYIDHTAASHEQLALSPRIPSSTFLLSVPPPSRPFEALPLSSSLKPTASGVDPENAIPHSRLADNTAHRQRQRHSLRLRIGLSMLCQCGRCRCTGCRIHFNISQSGTDHPNAVVSVHTTNGRDCEKEGHDCFVGSGWEAVACDCAAGTYDVLENVCGQSPRVSHRCGGGRCYGTLGGISKCTCFWACGIQVTICDICACPRHSDFELNTDTQLDSCQVVQHTPPPPTSPLHTLQLGSSNRPAKTTSRALLGHFAKAGVPPKYEVRSFQVTPDAVLPVGTELSAAHFVPGQMVDVTATSIGKGFQGPMKRHGFRGLKATHGVSLTHRSGGSTGQHQVCLLHHSCCSVRVDTDRANYSTALVEPDGRHPLNGPDV